MIDLLRLCRLYYAVPMSLAYALTVYYALGGETSGRPDPGEAGMRGFAALNWAEVALSTAALALVIAAGYVLNDVCDAAIDRAAAPGRAIAAGRVGRRTGGVWGGLLMAAGLAVAATCRWQFLAALAVVAAGLVFYDLFSKRLGVGKQLLVAALMTSIYPLALAESGGAAGSRAGSLAIFPAWLFLTAFGYEVLKDLRDRSSDPRIGGRETAIQRRPRLWRTIAAISILGAAPLLVGPFFTGCRWVYLAVALVAALAAVASAFLPLRWAIRCVYAECFIVGLAATLDLIVFGM